MQYTTDLKNVYFHFSEVSVRSVSQNLVACYSPLYERHRELLFIFEMKQLFFETFGRNFDLY